MRALCFVVMLGACSPTITPGSYLCGPEQLCPETQSCNGPDNICVRTGQELPFRCPDSFDPAGDDSPATANLVEDLTCVSNVITFDGCLLAADPADFYAFDVPANCSSVGITATISYPIAFEPIAITFAKDAQEPQRMDTECPSSTRLVEGSDVGCLEIALEPGGHYVIGIVRDEAADADCDGACQFNRYQLRFQLETP